MQTISVRRLRGILNGAPGFAEPVAVVLRQGDGTMRQLGTWTPADSRVEVNAGFVTKTCPTCGKDLTGVISHSHGRMPGEGKT